MTNPTNMTLTPSGTYLPPADPAEHEAALIASVAEFKVGQAVRTPYGNGRIVAIATEYGDAEISFGKGNGVGTVPLAELRPFFGGLWVAADTRAEVRG